MQKAIIGVLVLGIIGAAAYTFFSVDQEKTNATLDYQKTTYSNSDLGLEFDYQPGPEGYVAEVREPAAGQGDLLSTIILMRTEDAERAMPEGGEGPPVIAISVFKNSNNQSPLAWANDNVQHSNINLKMGETSETVVGGANAIRYMADGLYASDTVVVAHGGFVYVATGMYIDQDSDIRRDFEPLLNSIRFIPAPGQTDAPTMSGKIDINAVCEGALAFMSFPDGAAAEKFVADCKEGKHPGVIEQYKSAMGLGADAQI